MIKVLTFILKIVRNLLRLTFLVIVFIASFAASQLVHGMGHLMAPEWIGGRADIDFIYISSDILPETLVSLSKFIPIGSSVHFVVQPANSYFLPVFYLSGGILAALLPWAFLWLFARIWRKEDSLWIEAISASLFLFHAFFAVAELALLDGMTLWAVVSISQLIFLMLYARPMVRWLRG